MFSFSSSTVAISSIVSAPALASCTADSVTSFTSTLCRNESTKDGRRYSCACCSFIFLKFCSLFCGHS